MVPPEDWIAAFHCGVCTLSCSVWVSSHTVPTHGSITDDTPLPVGVNVNLNGCLSQYVSPVMKWQYAAPATAQRHRNRRVLSFQGGEGWNGFSVACVDPTPVGNRPQTPTLTIWAIPSSSSTQMKCNDLTNDRKVDQAQNSCSIPV